ncbi:MAG: outer membrane protein assembly factor BamB, partial [Candidatus Accumulibacter sp.]|nr:outer membrane protein assembly factor BamB [Accumulibacter sp.]
MRRVLVALLLPALLAGCSSFDSINPFASSGPKMAELQPIQATANARVVWKDDVGKGDPYTFVP